MNAEWIGPAGRALYEECVREQLLPLLNWRKIVDFLVLAGAAFINPALNAAGLIIPYKTFVSAKHWAESKSKKAPIGNKQSHRNVQLGVGSAEDSSLGAQRALNLHSAPARQKWTENFNLQNRVERKLRGLRLPRDVLIKGTSGNSIFAMLVKHFRADCMDAGRPKDQGNVIILKEQPVMA